MKSKLVWSYQEYYKHQFCYQKAYLRVSRQTKWSGISQQNKCSRCSCLRHLQRPFQQKGILLIM